MQAITAFGKLPGTTEGHIYENFADGAVKKAVEDNIAQIHLEDNWISASSFLGPLLTIHRICVDNDEPDTQRAVTWIGLLKPYAYPRQERGGHYFGVGFWLLDPAADQAEDWNWKRIGELLTKFLALFDRTLDRWNPDRAIEKLKAGLEKDLQTNGVAKSGLDIPTLRNITVPYSGLQPNKSNRRVCVLNPVEFGRDNSEFFLPEMGKICRDDFGLSGFTTALFFVDQVDEKRAVIKNIREIAVGADGKAVIPDLASRQRNRTSIGKKNEVEESDSVSVDQVQITNASSGIGIRAMTMNDLHLMKNQIEENFYREIDEIAAAIKRIDKLNNNTANKKTKLSSFIVYTLLFIPAMSIIITILVGGSLYFKMENFSEKTDGSKDDHKPAEAGSQRSKAIDPRVTPAPSAGGEQKSQSAASTIDANVVKEFVIKMQDDIDRSVETFKSNDLKTKNFYDTVIEVRSTINEFCQTQNLTECKREDITIPTPVTSSGSSAKPTGGAKTSDGSPVPKP